MDKNGRGDHAKPMIMFEVVASQELWIWHTFFGIAGSNYKINVLNKSTLFNDVLEGQTSTIIILDTIKHIIYTCVILHNIIVKNEHTRINNFEYDHDIHNTTTKITNVSGLGFCNILAKKSIYS
ncbi:hypothetical protein CR513_20067, partial [Mucuna pruriens]